MISTKRGRDFVSLRAENKIVTDMNRKVLLMILDGWGEGKHDHSNAIYTAGTPFIDSLRAKYPMSHLLTCGEAVGLPDGQMGNSEVGHMNLGAGRVVYQDLMKINKTCRDHKLLSRAEVKGVYDYVKESGKKLHLMGLCSTGGVHSSLDHYYEFLNVAKEYGLENVYVHCFMDGRDTDPHSGKGFVADLEKHMAESTGKVATVCGRFYAMDRDKRWARVKEAYDLLTEGKGAAFTSATEGIQASYDADVTDEFIKPIESGKKLHLMGLCSTGGVHSSLDHYYEFLNVAKEYGLENVYVHCFMDGRDTDPHSGKGFVADLEKHMAESTGKVATVCGRFYAMDRDKRWARVKEAYDLLTEGKGAAFTSATEGIQASYDADVTDEFIKPIVVTDAAGAPLAKIEEGDAVIFMNFRNDRAREITSVLTQQDMPEEGMHVIPNLYYCCMTPYDAAFKGLHILFDKEIVKDTLGEIVSKAGLHQLRIAETEKYAHVTFFFNGGRETPFENEDRILVPSPKVPTYDLQPEMSAPIVTEKLIGAIDSDKDDLIILNYANGDMIGHTGVYDAIVKAVRCIDGCVEKVVTEAIKHDYVILITADHGNADHAVNEDGTPNTAHSLNPVQFIVVNAGDEVKSVKDGALCNVAPTILKLMGLPQPADMDAEPLI